VPPETIHAQQAFKQAGLVAGFNRKWGLPLPQTLAIQAGSVFTFVSDQPLSQSKLAALVSNGLGERRAEGFGRVAINGWPYTQPRFQLAAEEQDPQKIVPPGLSGESLRLARLMTRRHQQRTLERQLAQAINEIQLRKPPKKSQLGGLRVVLRTALAEQKTATALDYLRKMRPAGRRQFEQARVVRARQNLYDWLEVQLETPDGVWELLSYQPSNHNPLGLDLTIADNADEQLAVTYTLRLLDGVLAKATKQAGGNS
jgi:CRISPR-associated protein Csx10